MKTAVVIGAAGDVGRGIVGALHGAGYKVRAVGRTMETLERLRKEIGIPELDILPGSIASPEDANRLATAISEPKRPDVVIVTVSSRANPTPLTELAASDVERVLSGNLMPHLAAANALIPCVAPGGVYIGIGGGMADNIFPGMAAMSITQAAQRVLYHYLAKDPAFAGPHIRELMLYSMIAGKSSAEIAEPHWITADEVGRHVVAILGDLETFDGPILTLKSRKQIGLPERKPV